MRDLASTLLPILSIPGSLGILNINQNKNPQCKQMNQNEFCLPSHYKHAIRLCYLPWPLPCMPCITVSTSLQAMPGGVAFSQNKLLNIPLLADWNVILAQSDQLQLVSTKLPLQLFWFLTVSSWTDGFMKILLFEKKWKTILCTTKIK